MADIYDHHEAAFRQVSGYVILKDGERVATVALKFPADGAGRLYAYVHWLGTEMVRGFANGGGYDKRSAAVAAAADKMTGLSLGVGIGEDENHPFRAFYRAARRDGGQSWDRALEKAGFTVLQAI